MNELNGLLVSCFDFFYICALIDINFGFCFWAYKLVLFFVNQFITLISFPKCLGGVGTNDTVFIADRVKWFTGRPKKKEIDLSAEIADSFVLLAKKVSKVSVDWRQNWTFIW